MPLGTAHGAGTVVNAMATGYGAAFGLKLNVRATVRHAARFVVRSNGRRLPADEAAVARECLRLALPRGAPVAVDVRSEIPSQKGLKSSSAVAVAVLGAAARFAGRRLSEPQILLWAAEAGLRSGTSRTGAFDDASACLLGGLVLTDNTRRRILARAELPRHLVALVRVPRDSIPTRRFLRSDLRAIRPRVEEAFALVRAGRVREAMITNTLAYAEAFGLDTRFTWDALEAGAWAAGLSGKGPAEIALVPRRRVREFVRGSPRPRVVELFHGGPE